MGELLDADEYGSWFSYLFFSHNYVWIVVVSTLVSLGLFGLGYLVAVVGNVRYLTRPEPYIGGLGVFWVLVWLGWADSVYVDVWNEVRSAFAIDDETYYDVVRPRLERIHDERRIFTLAVVITVPFYLLVTVMFIEGMPYHRTLVELFTTRDGRVQTHGSQILRTVDWYLLVTVGGVLIATVVNGFANHLALVNEVSELPFRNIHTSSSALEPVAGFTVTSATAWFVGVTPLALWILTGVDRIVLTVLIVLVVVVGVVYFLAPQLILHDALAEAKQVELAEIRAEYEEIQELTRRDTVPSENLSLRLEVTDRRLENAESISTWVYDLSSIGMLVASSATPVLTFVQEFDEVLNLIG